jgi:hypothetical protein
MSGQLYPVLIGDDLAVALKITEIPWHAAQRAIPPRVPRKFLWNLT